jgi:ADP-ribosylglycohydrolase
MGKVRVSIFEGMNDSVFLEDKLRGMLLLSAYGDALGAPHEGKPPQFPLCSQIPPTRSFYRQGDSPWWIWLPAEHIPDDTIGMVTDDTLYRLFVLYPYVSYVLKNELRHDEATFYSFLCAEAHLSQEGIIPDARLPNVFWCHRRRHLQDWIKMFTAAQVTAQPATTDPQAETSYGFFSPGVAVCFGIYLYLPLVIAYLQESVQDIFTRFSQMTGLDQSHAAPATGIFSVILQEAFKQQSDSPEDFSGWFLSTINRCRHINAFAPDGISRFNFDRIYKCVDSLSYQPRNGLKSDLQEAMEWSYRLRQTGLPTGVSGLHHDSAEFLALMTLAVILFPDSPGMALVFLANCGGDTDTIAALFGLILGAYLGYNRLITVLPDNLQADLFKVRGVLQKLLLINIDDVCHTFSLLHTSSLKGKPGDHVKPA